jgi:hypothetical protein
MLLKQFKQLFARGYAAFTRRVDLFFTRHMNPARIFLLLTFGLLAGLVGIGIYNDKPNNDRFDHLSAAEHLNRALVACGADAKNCLNPADAYRELWAIPKSAQEYNVASALLLSIQQQQISTQPSADKLPTSEQNSANKLPASEQPYDQMQRNVQGIAHDAFTCANSTENTPIMSFDNGNNWWKDDGRCAEQLQKARDSEAENYSYWSTTLRVDTDIDSFWLPGEERTCQTYPDNKGKVATVACTSTGTHRDHNIPVKFWGGVERNTISDWKCRREGDEFVCRAID